MVLRRSLYKESGREGTEDIILWLVGFLVWLGLVSLHMQSKKYGKYVHPYLLLLLVCALSMYGIIDANTGEENEGQREEKERKKKVKTA